MNEMPPYEQEELLPVDLPRGNQRAAEGDSAMRRFFRGAVLGVAMVLSAGGDGTVQQANAQETKQGGVTPAERAKAFKNEVTVQIANVRTKYAILPIKTIMREAARDENDSVLRAALYSLALEKAVSMGDAATMEEAFVGMQCHGFTVEDAFAYKVAALRRIGEDPVRLHKMDGMNRIAMAQDILQYGIDPAIKAEDLALAKALWVLAQKYLNGARITASSPQERNEKTAKLMQARKDLGKMLERLNELQQLSHIYKQALGAGGQPETPAAHRTVAMWKMTIGRWDEALRHLVQCDNAALVKAAALEIAGPQTAEQLLACGQAWIAAAQSDKSGNRKEWYARAVKMISAAQQHSPGGMTTLDILAAAKELERAGVVIGPGKQGAAAQETFPKGKWVSFLQKGVMTNVEKNGGEWVIDPIQKRVTVRNNGGNCRMLFDIPPEVLENGYEIEYTLEHVGKLEGMYIPIGNTGYTTLLHCGFGTSGLDRVGRKRWEENETTVRGSPQAGSKMKITVRPNGKNWDVIIMVNGKIIINCNKPAKDFDLNDDWQIPQPKEVGQAKRMGFIGNGPDISSYLDPKIKRIEPPTRPTNVPKEAMYWNGSWYLFLEKKLTLPEAVAVARKLGGKVLIVSSEEENDFIARKISDPTYLGTIKRGTKWVTLEGDEQTYFKWDTQRGEPGGNEPYSTLMPSGYWHDVQHTDRNCIIIEWGDEKHKTK